MGADPLARTCCAVIAVAVLGPPASGKTTAVRSLVERSADVAHFKVRDHFQSLLAENDRIAVAHREQLRRRDVLADDVVRYAFTDFVRRHSTADVVLVEGYPRSPAQHSDLRAVLSVHGGRAAGAVVFDAPDEVLYARVTRRLVCPVCDLSGTRGPDVACPHCGVDLVVRPDDDVIRFAERVRQFRSAGAGAGRLFAETGRVVVLDASLPQELVADRLWEALRRLGACGGRQFCGRGTRGGRHGA